VFDRVLRDRPHQKDRKREDVKVTESDLLNVRVPGGAVSESGVSTNVSVALHYIEAWLRGIGAVAINNLMEDAATAEISRTQLWQWIRHGQQLSSGGTVTAELYRNVREDELASMMVSADGSSRWQDAAALLDELVLGEFQEFLTIPGYRRLVSARA
jgi:malate synthase